ACERFGQPCPAGCRARIVVQDVPYDPWALADFFSKDQLGRGPERIVRRSLSLHRGAGAEPRIRPPTAACPAAAGRISCHAVAANQPNGLAYTMQSQRAARKKQASLALQTDLPSIDGGFHLRRQRF